jgi:hypothetical protein
LGDSQDQEGLKSETLVSDEAKPNTKKKGPQVVAVKQNKAQGKETEIRAAAVAIS